MTVTSPTVALPPLLATVIVNTNGDWPCRTGVACDLVMVSCGPRITVTGSEAVLLPGEASPPPLTIATFTKLDASGAMSAISAIEGNAAPGASTSERVQLPARDAALQLQPAPDAARTIMPGGAASLTLTAPLVGDAPALRTVTVNSTPV